MVVTMVTITAYCYGPRTRTCPRQKGSFLAIFQYGGRERSISPPSGQEIRFAGFAVRIWQCVQASRKPGQRGPVRVGGNAEGANLGAYPVCTPVARKTARDENSMLVRGCGGFSA